MECALTIVLLQVLVLLALSGAESSAAGTGAVGVRPPAGDASMSAAPEAYHQLVEPIGKHN
jgi:hypothetical protein